MKKRKKKILIVEDDKQVQVLYNFLLPPHYELIMVDSVLDASKTLDANQIDCVILDLSLAGEYDGLELARIIRQDQNNSTLPIIAITAHAFDSDRIRVQASGCNEYMSKPIDQDELVEAIENLLKD